MKVMIRKNPAGIFSAYIAKKDLEEPIVEMENEGLWGGVITLANGMRLALPEGREGITFPCTVEARKLGEE